MGRFDSSRTRVAPLFNHLYCRDTSGRTWLPQLLQLVGASCPPLPQRRLKSARWWPREAALPAPPSLLRWLVENCEPPINERDLGKGEVQERRQALLRRDEAAIAEALRILNGPAQSRAWCVFEGASQPDVYLESADLVVVIEGKRTEPGPTTSTTWMRERHQMLRHIDAAWDTRGNRTVVGMMIVEAGADEASVPSPWREYRGQIDARALERSLPHRSDAERREIAEAFVGSTTWQSVVAALRVPADVLIDILPDGGT